MYYLFYLLALALAIFSFMYSGWIFCVSCFFWRWVRPHMRFVVFITDHICLRCFGANDQFRSSKEQRGSPGTVRYGGPFIAPPPFIMLSGDGKRSKCTHTQTIVNGRDSRWRNAPANNDCKHHALDGIQQTLAGGGSIHNKKQSSTVHQQAG